MKQILSDTERNQLDQLIKEAEERTKAQIVLVVVKRCDNYPEIPWKAFALSVAITGFLIFLYNLMVPGWISNMLVFFSMAAPLVAGAFFVLLTVLFPRSARLFLSDNRVEAETRQYAESLFYNREFFATEGRTGVLLLVSQFERWVVILPDKGLSNRVTAGAMKKIIDKMSLHLRHKEIKLAMETGLEQLIKALEDSASDNPVKDELSDEIIEEAGV